MAWGNDLPLPFLMLNVAFLCLIPLDFPTLVGLLTVFFNTMVLKSQQ